MDNTRPMLVVVSGWTGAGKSTIADSIAGDIAATVASFDWIMSGLRSLPDVWTTVEVPAQRQREIGWSLLSRIAEQQLRRGSSCVLDLVAREQAREKWKALAERNGATYHVIECICSDEEIHRTRIEGRRRDIPDWYELAWGDVLRGRKNYAPLAEPKLVLDSVHSLTANLAQARSFLDITS